MGLPVNFYEGRHDPDHTTWLEYFVGTMARGSKAIREKAVMLYQGSAPSRARPWENLKRVQQQLLTRLLVVAVSSPSKDVSFTPTDISEWYGISPNTAREWLEDWRSDGFVCPHRAEAKRVRRYLLTQKWNDLLMKAAINASVKTT